jgi:hypothetical protein
MCTLFLSVTLKTLHMETHSSYLHVTKTSLDFTSDPSDGEELQHLTLETLFMLTNCDLWYHGSYLVYIPRNTHARTNSLLI